MPNSKFRKIEVRELGCRILDLNIKIEHGAPWEYRGTDIDNIALTIKVIVCGQHGQIKFEDWIFDTEPLEASVHHRILRYLDLGGFHDFELVGPKASVKIRIRRNYLGHIFWDLIEKNVKRRGLNWAPKLAVA